MGGEKRNRKGVTDWEKAKIFSGLAYKLGVNSKGMGTLNGC